MSLPLSLSEQDRGTRLEMRSRFESREDMQRMVDMGTVDGLQQAVSQVPGRDRRDPARRAKRGAGPAGCRMCVLTPKRSPRKSRPTGDALHGVRHVWLSLLAISSRPARRSAGVTSFRLRIRTATEQ